MVGGKIIDIFRVNKDKWWINCRDKNDECAIYLKPAGNDLQIGDSLWWQGRIAYWTPFRDGEHIKPIDRELERIGYSGVRHPLAFTNEQQP